MIDMRGDDKSLTYHRKWLAMAQRQHEWLNLVYGAGYQPALLYLHSIAELQVRLNQANTSQE